jgi:hypothetical protein
LAIFSEKGLWEFSPMSASSEETFGCLLFTLGIVIAIGAIPFLALYSILGIFADSPGLQSDVNRSLDTTGILILSMAAVGLAGLAIAANARAQREKQSGPDQNSKGTTPPRG